MSIQTNFILHDRSITNVQFNRDGDLLFVTSKDKSISVTRLPNTILGTYDAHEGAIICMDLSEDSTRLVTGGTDKLLILWDVETGVVLEKHECNSMVRSIHLCNTIYFTTDDAFNQKPLFANINDMQNAKTLSYTPTDSVMRYDQSQVVISDSEGCLHLNDLRTTDSRSVKVHSSKINKLRNSFCKSFFVTASTDYQSKIVDYDLDVVKTFVTENPVNSAAIFRTNDKLICAGGLTARDVTTTRSSTQFDVNFFDIATTNLVGSYSTHFGTINCVDINPAQNLYCSGGEDGIACLIEMEDDFMTAPFTVY